MSIMTRISWQDLLFRTESSGLMDDFFPKVIAGEYKRSAMAKVLDLVLYNNDCGGWLLFFNGWVMLIGI